MGCVTSLLDGDYLGRHSSIGDCQNSYRGWDHERLVRLAGVQEEDSIAYFTDSLMKVPEQNRVDGTGEIRK